MPENIANLVQENMEQLLPLMMEQSWGLVNAILLVLTGFWLAGRIQRWIARAMTLSQKPDETLTVFFSSAGRYLVIAVTVLAALSQLGIETTSLIALLGAAGLAVGLALQGTLSNIAAGIMLLIFRPFKVNDFVEITGTAGTVQAISLFTTELATPDNVQIVVPNSTIWGQPVKNYSTHSARRVDCTFGISYSDDIDKAMGVIRTAVAADSRIHANPEPFIVVGNLGDSSVDLIVRVWCDNTHYWGVKFDLKKSVKEALDSNAISIPFPTRTVYQVSD